MCLARTSKVIQASAIGSEDPSEECDKAWKQPAMSLSNTNTLLPTIHQVGLQGKQKTDTMPFFFFLDERALCSQAGLYNGFRYISKSSALGDWKQDLRCHLLSLLTDSLIEYFQWQGSHYCRRLLIPSENISSINSSTYITPLKKHGCVFQFSQSSSRLYLLS